MAKPKTAKEPHPHGPSNIPGGYEGHSHSWESFRQALLAFLEQLSGENLDRLGMNLEEREEFEGIRERLHEDYAKRFKP